MTINIDNKTWIRYPAQVSGGRFYSDVDKVPASGTWSITGSGFGSAPTLASHSFVDLETLGSGDPLPTADLNGYSAGALGTYAAVSMTTTGSRKSGLPCLYSQNNGDNNTNRNSTVFYDLGSVLAAGEKLLVSFWMKLKPTSPGIGDGQHKILRLTTAKTISDATGDVRLFHWFQTTPGPNYAVAATGNSQTFFKISGQAYPSDYVPQFDENWYRFDLEFQASSNSTANGVFKPLGYKATGAKTQMPMENGTVPAGVSYPNAVITRTSDSDSQRYIAIQNLFANGTTNALKDLGGEVWIDDIYVQRGAWKRIELTNAATLAASTVREIQPFTTWTDTEITGDQIVSVYTGTRYLHVVDDTGVSLAVQEVVV